MMQAPFVSINANLKFAFPATTTTTTKTMMIDETLV
jgi:hypothetical protein